MYTNFVVEKADRIATLTLNRPEKRNPITEEMLGELETIVQELRDDAVNTIAAVAARELNTVHPELFPQSPGCGAPNTLAGTGDHAHFISQPLGPSGSWIQLCHGGFLPHARPF